MRIAINVACIVLSAIGVLYAVDDPYWIDNLEFVDFNSSGLGARSRAMGGVYLALDNEGCASFENPATMVKTNKSLMSFDLTDYKDKHEKPYLFIYSTTNADSNLILHPNPEKNLLKITQAGAVAPFTYFGRDWWIGGGYHTVYDFNLSYDIDIPEPWNPTNSYHREKTMDALNMALATRLHEYLSMGLNINYYTRRYEEEYLSRKVYFDTTVNSYVDFRNRDKSNFSGFNADIGFFGEYDIFAAGLVIRTPYTLRQQVLQKFTLLYAYGYEVGTIDRVTLKYKIPLSYAFGFSIRPIEQLTLAADLDIKPYSNVKMSLDYEINNIRDYHERDAKWNDLTQMRVGAEYIFDAGFAKIPLRAGYHNVPAIRFVSKMVIDTVTVDTSLTEQTTNVYSDKIKPAIISFGAGLKFERIWFDLAYEFGSKKYDSQLVYVGLQHDMPFEFKYSRLNFSIGMLF